jgi:hypothetical protein
LHDVIQRGDKPEHFATGAIALRWPQSQRPGPMTFEVRKLNRLRRLPPGGSWVLIERKGGSYFLAGRANGKPVDPHIAPEGFGNPRAAIFATIIWAEYLDAPIVFVKDES